MGKALTEAQVNRAFRLFYGDGMTLRMVMDELGCGLSALSPWLTAPAARIASAAIEDERAAVAARASDTGRSEAEADDSFSRELQAAYARNDADGYARILSGRLRRMDKRAKAANVRADHLEVKLRLMRVRAEGAEADRGAGRALLYPPAGQG